MPSHKKTGSTASLNEKLNADPLDSMDKEVEEQDVDMLDHPSYQELQTRLTEAEEKATQSWERLLRTQAEIDNLQRRAERDVANAHKYSLEKFVLELLPIIDGLERAVGAHAEDDTTNNGLLDGLNMTLRMLYAAFEKFGIQQVNPEFQPFNPELHQAVSTQVDPSAKPGTVLAVLQKGYLLNNRLIRPALVVVAKN
jgi:molecular chaperone GrpE